MPDGVAYRFMDDARLAKVREFLAVRFAKGEAGVSELFHEECMCAPGYWRLLGRPGTAAPELVKFSIPNRRSGKTYELEGAHLKDGRDLKVLAAKITTELGRKPSVRRLTSKEIARFWIVVPFEIEEPVFMFEGASQTLVVCLKATPSGGWRIWWIDALAEYDYGE